MLTDEEREWLNSYQFPEDMFLRGAITQFMREFHHDHVVAAKKIAQWIGEINDR